MQRAVEQRDVLRHDGDGLAQALLGDLRDVLAVDQDAARLDVVEALQQGEDRRLAAARCADQADALAGVDVKARGARRSWGRRDRRTSTFSKVTLAPRRARASGVRTVAHLVRHEQGGERLREPRHVLRHVDEARRPDRAWRAGRRDPACRPGRRRPSSPRRAATRRSPRPADRSSAPRSRGRGASAAAPGRAGFAAARSSPARPLSSKRRCSRRDAAERPHDGHVADDVDHLAVDRRSAIGEGAMQRLAGGGPAEHDRRPPPRRPAPGSPPSRS